MCSFDTFGLFCTVSSIYQRLNFHFSVKVQEGSTNFRSLTKVQFQAVMLTGSAAVRRLKAY